MARSSLLHFLILACLIFLSMQWFLYQRAQEVDHELVALNEQSHFTHIANMTSVFHKNGVPLFLVDPTVLHQILGGSNQGLKCRFLCHGRLVTYFAAEFEFLLNEDSLFKDLLQQNFTCFTYKQQAPFVFKTKEIMTHLEVHRDGHTSLIVALFRRGASNEDIWHASIRGPPHKMGSGHQVAIARKLVHANFNSASLWHKFQSSKVSIDGLPLRAPSYPDQFLAHLRRSRFLECDYSSAKRFFKLYPKDNSPQAESFRAAGLSVLQKAKSVLDELAIPFWLSSGTCLGWLRQCDFITYSGDVDIGIFIEDYKESLIPAMQQKGLVLKHVFGKVSDSFELSFEEDIKLDIFFFYDNGQHKWNGGTEVRTGNKFKYLFERFDLCWTEFHGLIVRVPCDPVTYVKANYGADWKSPVQEWDWKKSPPNVRQNGQWPQAERPKVIQSF